MIRSSAIPAVIVGFLAITIVAEAKERVPLASWAQAQGKTLAPRGWTQFCPKLPGECRSGDPSRVRLDEASWRLMRRVNQEVNVAIAQVKDSEHWAVEESWDLPLDGKGDCEDLALEKRRQLAAAGLSLGGLLMTVVRDSQGGGHAVLTVVTDRGDFVLDNLHTRIRPWRSTGYDFVKRQSPENPNVWLTLREDNARTAVTASQP